MTYFTQYHSAEITSRTDPYGGKKDNQLYCKEGPKGKALQKLYFIGAVSFYTISCTSADPNIFLGNNNSFLASFLIDKVNYLNEVHRWYKLKNGSDQLKVKGTFTARVKGRWSPAS